MKDKKSFAIIGGDLRQARLAYGLAKDGYDVSVFGFKDIEFDKEIIVLDSIQSAIKNVDIIIAPLPCSIDNETINAPFYTDKIYVTDLFKQMSKNQLFLGGRISEKIDKLAKVYKIYPIDYFNREELVILNAIPTAEGVMQIAMEEMPTTLHNSRCLILGFGRIGKVLSKMMKGIGAFVTVEARKYSDLAWIKSYDYEGIHINKLGEVLGEFDIIINTVPSVILDRELLLKIRKDCLVIDVASKPGGVDFEMARDLGVKTIWALSLPGKVAPNTAGDIIKDTVMNIIDELGV